MAVTVGRETEPEPAAPGARKAIWVTPIVMVSPSRSRWRLVTRAPLTYVPLRERPSSTTVQSSPRRSMAACTRETSESQSSTTSLLGRRPTVRRSPVAARSTIACSSLAVRYSRNGVPRRSAAMRSLSSRGVATCASRGDSGTR
jgi:hypothetical protein